MNTILLNGSPKGNAHNSASYLLAKAFTDGMQQACEIHSILKENRTELLTHLKQFDHIIIILPNYIHGVPGNTLDFLYALPAADAKQSLGFIIQCGFTEGSENELMSRFFDALAHRLRYEYMGTVMKGECAGLALMPNMFRKLIKQFSEFGALYEQTGGFDKQYCDKFASPYMLSRFQERMFNATNPIGNYIGWNKILKENNAFDKRLDCPYLD